MQSVRDGRRPAWPFTLTGAFVNGLRGGRTARPALPGEGPDRQGRSGLNESISPAFS